MLRRFVENDRLFFCGESGSVVFGMSEIETDNGVEITMDGDITSDAAPCFGDELISAALAYDNITLDLNGLGFISSSGFRVLLDAQNCIDNLSNKEMTIRKLSSSMRAAFEEIGYYELFLYIE